MLIGFDGEFVAAFKAAASEHCASVSSGHALAKTVYTHAAADLGLVCSFYHSKYFLIVKMIANPTGGVVCELVARNYTPMPLIRSI